MHGCLFDNGYLNVLYGTRCFGGWVSLMILVVTAVVIPIQQYVRRHARLVVSSLICIWSVSVRRPTTELCFCLHAHSLQKKLLLRDDLT